jgi:hypothetical protein
MIPFRIWWGSRMGVQRNENDFLIQSLDSLALAQYIATAYDSHFSSHRAIPTLRDNAASV